MAEEKNFRRSEVMSDEELDNVVGGAPQFQTFGNKGGSNVPEFVQEMIDKANREQHGGRIIVS